MLFYIQRNHNANTIIYDTRFDNNEHQLSSEEDLQITKSWKFIRKERIAEKALMLAEIEKHEKELAKKLARQLLKLNIPIEQIEKETGLSKEEINQLLNTKR